VELDIINDAELDEMRREIRDFFCGCQLEVEVTE
jgi:hypothetical protein